MVKKFILFFLIFISMLSMIFATPQEDCFNELKPYHPFDNLKYDDYKKNFSVEHNLDDPFLSLVFSRPIVVIKFNNIGEDTSLKVGAWPKYREYNFYELYIDNPNDFNLEFAGCGYLKPTPLGSYDFDKLKVELYKQQNLNSYKFTRDIDKSNFRIFETEHDTIDVNDELFLKMTILRVYYKNTNLYFKQYNILDNYKNAFTKYKNGDSAAIVDYTRAIVNSGENYAKYLRDYALFRDLNYNSGINTNTNPLIFNPNIPYTPIPANTGDIVTVDSLQSSIVQLNLELTEMENLGFLPVTTKIGLIGENELISRDKFYAINDKIKTLLNLVSKGNLFVELNLGNVAEKKDEEVIINNLNTYLNVKHCSNLDFNCGSWGTCSSLLSSRTVNKNRICIGENPKTSASCSWKLQTIGPSYDVPNGCSSDVYRDNIYYDVLGTWVGDYCGVYTLGQWLGHSSIDTEYVGSSDNCGGGDDGGGGN